MVSKFPKQLAYYQKYTLVQFNDYDLFLLSETELEALEIEKDSNLEKFSPKECIKAIKTLELKDLKNRKYQTYGKNDQILCLFQIGNDKTWYWLSKSTLESTLKGKGNDKNFMNGAQNRTYAQWKGKSQNKNKGSHDSSDEKMEGSKKRNKGRDDDGDQEMKDCKSGEEDEDEPEKEEDEDEDEEDEDEPEEDEDEDEDKEDEDDPEEGGGILESTERSSSVTRHNSPSSKPTKPKPKTGQPRRRITKSPGVSGETPPPGDGGKILYGINCSTLNGKKKTRGLVQRGNMYSFEDVDNCPSDLIIPDKSGGMAPSVDTEFMSERDKSDRNSFRIVGCTAKWHGRPVKRTLVILEFENEEEDELWEELQDKRIAKGYGYSGPVVCSWPIFRDSVCQKGDQEAIQNLLNQSEFAQGVPKKDLDLEIKREPEIKRVERKIDSNMERLERKIDALASVFKSRL